MNARGLLQNVSLFRVRRKKMFCCKFMFVACLEGIYSDNYACYLNYTLIKATNHKIIKLFDSNLHSLSLVLILPDTISFRIFGFTYYFTRHRSNECCVQRGATDYFVLEYHMYDLLPNNGGIKFLDNMNLLIEMKRYLG